MTRAKPRELVSVSRDGARVWWHCPRAVFEAAANAAEYEKSRRVGRARWETEIVPLARMLDWLVANGYRVIDAQAAAEAFRVEVMWLAHVRTQTERRVYLQWAEWVIKRPDKEHPGWFVGGQADAARDLHVSERTIRDVERAFITGGLADRAARGIAQRANSRFELLSGGTFNRQKLPVGPAPATGNPPPVESSLQPAETAAISFKGLRASERPTDDRDHEQPVVPISDLEQPGGRAGSLRTTERAREDVGLPDEGAAQHRGGSAVQGEERSDESRSDASAASALDGGGPESASPARPRQQERGPVGAPSAGGDPSVAEDKDDVGGSFQRGPDSSHPDVPAQPDHVSVNSRSRDLSRDPDPGLSVTADPGSPPSAGAGRPLRGSVTALADARARKATPPTERTDMTTDDDTETSIESLVLVRPGERIEPTEMIYQLVRQCCEIGEPITTDQLRMRLAGCGWVDLWDRERYVEALIKLRDLGRIGFVAQTTYWAPVEELAS